MTRSQPSRPAPSTPLLRERCKRLSQHLPKALAGDADAIHDMRVAARRLRVALPLLAQKPKGRRARQAMKLIRELTRAAGFSRDLDVGLALYDERRRESGTRTKELRALRRSLAGARQRGRERMAEALLDIEIARLRRHLAVIQKRGGEPAFTVFARARKAVQTQHDAIVVDLETLGGSFDAEALHRIRTQCRTLRYTAEVLDAARGQESRAPKLLRELQESLGRLHDVHVLAAWLQHSAERAQLQGRRAQAAAARSECRAFLEECRALHGAFLASGPRRILAEALALILPSRAVARA